MTKETNENKIVKVGSHLKSSDDLDGFPEFPAGTKSLLSKHLSKDVWNQLQH